MFPTDEYRKGLRAFRALMLKNRRLAGLRLDGDHWTLGEMVGHLVDSAGNNHQRFVRLQLERELAFPAYDGDAWLRVSKTDSCDYRLLVRLWADYNEYLLHIVEGMDEGCLGWVWMTERGELTLDFLVRDYYRHLDWHRELFERRIGELKARKPQKRPLG